MSSTLIFVGLPEDSKSSISKLPSTTTSSDLQTVELEELRVPSSSAAIRVPNAPKSCIAEIFSTDSADGSPVKNGNLRPRVVRDTPTRPRDTHSRLFGQAVHTTVAPLVTDTIRSNIQFGGSQINGASPAHSPSKMTNGSQASSTPSRASYSPPKRNPVTGDGIHLPPPRRRHPAASLREGNPITGDGYKSLNGQINTVTSVNGSSGSFHRVPPGGFSSGLW
ncbi:microtubule-associated protein Jupiter isoform X2 [Plodia interpunctella]|uniref:microtubule-associated protein Jupiter isoform X2 n=1 Tax=Plodia interpunctella TaxID=58824 RepID=UPI0023680C14|nr:microtubule-associated protein Jupiter isoform X2 [Plodia interpunctella]